MSCLIESDMKQRKDIVISIIICVFPNTQDCCEVLASKLLESVQDELDLVE